MLVLCRQSFLLSDSIVSLALLWSSKAFDDKGAIASISGSGLLPETGIDSALTCESEAVPLID